jgi:hypothetical protein
MTPPTAYRSSAPLPGGTAVIGRVRVASSEEELRVSFGRRWDTCKIPLGPFFGLFFVSALLGVILHDGHSRLQAHTLDELLWLFPIATGLLVVGGLAWMLFGREEIVVQRGTLTITQALFFLKRRRVVRRSEVSAVRLCGELTYAKGRMAETSYGVEVVGERCIRSLRHLTSVEAAQVVLMIRAWMAGETDPEVLIRL